MELNSYIRKQLQDRGLKLNFVAAKCGVTPTSMYNYMHGRRAISKSVLKLLELQFGIETTLPEDGGSPNAKAS